MKNLGDELKIIIKETGVEKELQKSFQEAMNDDDFKKMCQKLNLDDNILMRYTSKIKDSVKETNHCFSCKGIFECKNKIEGLFYFPEIINGKLLFIYKECHYKQQIDNDSAYLKNIYLFDIPREIKEAKMSEIDTTDKKRYPCIKWLKEFIKNYPNNPNCKGLYLNGNFGGGKTYLIAAMFNELAHNNYRSAIVFWPEFLRDLKASFDDDFKEKYLYIKKVPLLLIDDIGAENNTAWGRDEILSPLLQYRMQEKLPTFFTSNFDLKSLERHFSLCGKNVEEIKGQRIIERIKFLTENMEMIAENKRNYAKKD